MNYLPLIVIFLLLSKFLTKDQKKLDVDKLLPIVAAVMNSGIVDTFKDGGKLDIQKILPVIASIMGNKESE